MSAGAQKQKFYYLAQSWISTVIGGDVEGVSPEAVLTELKETCKNPFGMFFIGVWANEDAYEKGHQPLAKWRSRRKGPREVVVH